MTRQLLYILLALAALASSCSGIRDCAAPQLNLPAALADNDTDSLTAADIEWWKIYSDPALTSIIEETLAHNRDFLAAAERIEQARELYGLAKADFLPTISANALADRETNAYHGKPSTVDPEFDLKATLSWEADLWGGLSWRKRRAAADFAATVEDHRAMQVSLIAEVASAYFTLLALDNELSIVRQTLYTRDENLKKAKLRFEGGLTSETVYRQAQVEYATTAALIPGLELRIKQQTNAITLLMGRYPGEALSRGHLSLEEQIPAEMPVGLPSTLLQRRPDLRSAEASLRSALASVGVAYADRFPRLRIALTGGFENDDLKSLFSSPFSYIIGSVAGSVFDFGRNKRRHRAAIAAYEQSRLAYEQRVLEAFHEVDDAAAAFRLVRRTTASRRELRDAAYEYTRLAYFQYNSGQINYIDVLDAQRRYFDAQVGLSNAVRDEYLALVALYKALGGGWQLP